MITDVVVTPGETEVVSLPMAKKHLRIEPAFTDEDDLIAAYIDAAVSYCEMFIGGFLSGTATIKMDDLPLRTKLLLYPVKAITSVSYYPANESTAVTVEPTSYGLMGVDKASYFNFNTDIPKLFERPDAVTLEVEVGYETIPKPIVQAVLLMIGDMYERREDRGEVISTAADKLLRPYKLY